MDNLLTQDQTTTPTQNGIPTKFWDANTQSIRTDALLKSYLELEKKLTRQQQQLQNYEQNQPVQAVNNAPASHEDYCINCDHGYFQADPELNQQLHGKGFSNDQAQFVYDLAAEKLVPLVLEVAQEFEAQRELDKLHDEFGGQQGWQQIAAQIQAWGKKNLPTPVFQALSSTHGGIMAMHQMMHGGETNPVSAQSQPNAPDHDLNSMIKDPRYWQQKDPAYVAKVTAAFQRKYAN